MSATAYRKKPVEIQAMKFDGTNRGEIVAWMREGGFRTVDPLGPDFLVPTLEGNMRASIGDVIIRGVQGEFYPCKPDIFEQTYERVEKPELSPEELAEVDRFGIYDEGQEGER